MPRNDLRAKLLNGLPIALKSTQSPTTATQDTFRNVASMETYLLAQGLTQATLDKMTVNDLIAECRRRLGATVDTSK